MKLKKIAVPAMSFVMCLSFAAPAFAEVVAPQHRQETVAVANTGGEVLAGLVPVQSDDGISARTITYMVTGNGVRVRTQPNLSSTILGLLYEGDLVAKLANEPVRADNYLWYCVQITKSQQPDNLYKIGWIAEEFLIEN